MDSAGKRREGERTIGARACVREDGFDFDSFFCSVLFCRFVLRS